MDECKKVLSETETAFVFLGRACLQRERAREGDDGALGAAVVEQVGLSLVGSDARGINYGGALLHVGQRGLCAMD